MLITGIIIHNSHMEKQGQVCHSQRPSDALLLNKCIITHHPNKSYFSTQTYGKYSALKQKSFSKKRSYGYL